MEKDRSKIVEWIVPGMSVDVYTKDKITGKRVKKRDVNGKVVSVTKIMAKERPRFALTQKKDVFGKIKFQKRVYSTSNTTDFESWIRTNFFKKYRSNYGVCTKKGKTIPVHEYFIGCMRYGKDVPCTDFRTGQDFKSCKNCKDRRKNLRLDLLVFLKDERHIDLDNIVKIVLDAMNSVCFFDDTQFTVKHVMLVPYAKQEQLAIRIYEQPVQWVNGSLVGNYPLHNLLVKDAREYVNYLYGVLGLSRYKDEFKDYLKRCDKRNLID